VASFSPVSAVGRVRTGLVRWLSIYASGMGAIVARESGYRRIEPHDALSPDMQRDLAKTCNRDKRRVSSQARRARADLPSGLV